MKKRMKITFNAPIILGFTAISFALIMLDFLTNGTSTHELMISSEVSFTSPMTYIRLLTHVFCHADWEHFIGNIMYILLLGPMLEEKYSSVRVLEVIVITAFITGLIHILFFENALLCGASGVCFAFILLASFTNFGEGEIPLTFIIVAVIYIGQQIHSGLFLQDNISNMSHILGGIIGSVAGYILNKK